MENKKTIIGIIIVIILIAALGVTSYLYSKFTKEQLNLLTEETNKLLKLDISTEYIDSTIKTEKNFGIVEKHMKEHLAKLKNLYEEENKLYNSINPNDIFSASNIEDKEFDDIDAIIDEYKEKSKNYYEEYKKLTEEQNIMKNIESANITSKKEYYIDLYKTAMLSDVMKEKYQITESQIERKKDDLTGKLEQLNKIKEYLDENQRNWTIKDEKIQFTNLNIMTEYYNLLNQLAD